MDKVMSTQSISVQFDDLMRHHDHYKNYEVDSEFLNFVKYEQDYVVKRWQEADAECRRLQSELAAAHSEMARNETKIQNTRRFLETKVATQDQLEAALDKVTLRVDSAKAIIRTYINDPRVGQDTKDRLYNIMALLEGNMIDDVDAALKQLGRSPNGALDVISEANSTDLSMTQSEDDLDLSIAAKKATSGRRRHSQKRPSLSNEPPPKYIKKQHQFTPGGTKQTVELSSNDPIVVKTIVSSSKDGVGHAVASVETQPGKKAYGDYVQPTAPYMQPSDTEGETYYSPPRRTPNLRSQTTSAIYSNSSRGSVSQRPHTFCQKTVIRPETCEPCGKRIKFSKMAFKCRDCKATCHPECKDKVPLPCVMTGTPVGNKHQMGTITDYAPLTHPMVPGILQHCINAIESRGKDMVGLYRIPGSEKDVKELKEKFLKGKGSPSLARCDIHVICGCVKDFLKSLQEPLVGRWFWRDFSLASDITDPVRRMVELERIVRELPPANQDSLAFVILHLQRVAEMPEVKMPISNLTKIFGPTVVGYSGADIDNAQILKETKKQQQVMESFLSAPRAFWESFLFRPEETGPKLYEPQRSSGLLHSTPSHSVMKTRQSHKRIYFDDSPNARDRPVQKQKKIYFD